MSLADELAATERTKLSLGKIADMLERQGIDLAEIGTVKRVSLYQTLTKNADGDAETHDLAAIQFSPAWADGPQWPVIVQAPAVKMPVRTVKPRPADGWRVAVILPDIQIGYYRDVDGTLQPTHDEQALAVAMAITRSINPDEVVLLGDNLDLPEMSKYRHTPAFAQTTQASINRATVLAAQVCDAAPNARRRWLAGNHEERLPNFLLDNAKAAFGLRRGGTPDAWPVMSVPHLCRFDDSGMEYVPGYPAGHLWLNERLKVIHGTKAKSNASTAHAYLATEKVSVLFGHIHRREWAERTRDDWDGPKTIMAASPGCLARVDGAVPSTKGGNDLDGRPMTVAEDWQQGIGVVRYEVDGDHRFFYEQVAIHGGAAMYHGKVFA